MVRHIYIEPGRVYDTWARVLDDVVIHSGGESLTWKKGDVIEVTNKLEDGRWYGSIDGISRRWFDSSWVVSCGSPLPKEPGKVDEYWVQALHDIIPLKEGDLACRKGDIIGVSHKLENGLWKGTTDGATSGWFLGSSTGQCEQPVIIEQLLPTMQNSRM